MGSYHVFALSSDVVVCCRYSDYIQCPHCQRRFGQNAADRHIQFCREKAARMPKAKAAAAAAVAAEVKKTPPRTQVRRMHERTHTHTHASSEGAVG